MIRPSIEALALSLAATALSCVPASEPLPPAGAGGVAIEPSLAARGEPFTTSDGWALRFEKIVVRANVSAYPIEQGLGRYGNSETYLFDVMKPAELFARAIPTGAARVRLDLRGIYAPSPSERGGDVTVLGVEGADIVRFSQPADSSDETRATPEGPTVLLVVRAESQGREVMLDLALAAPSTGGIDSGQTVEIRANDVAYADLGAVPELVFSNGFGRIASADADGDGRVSAAELRAVSAPGSAVGERARTLLEELSQRAANFFVPL